VRCAGGVHQPNATTAQTLTWPQQHPSKRTIIALLILSFTSVACFPRHKGTGDIQSHHNKFAQKHRLRCRFDRPITWSLGSRDYVIAVLVCLVFVRKGGEMKERRCTWFPFASVDSVLLTAGANEADGAVEGLAWDGGCCECCGCEESDGEAGSENHRGENSTFHSFESVFKDLKQGKPFSNTYFSFQSLHIFRSLLVELNRCPKCRVNVHDSCVTKVREIDWSLFHGRQKYYPARYPFSRFNFWTSRLPFSSSHSIWDVPRSTRTSNNRPRNAPLCTNSFRGPLLFANELPLIERKRTDSGWSKRNSQADSNKLARDLRYSGMPILEAGQVRWTCVFGLLDCLVCVRARNWERTKQRWITEVSGSRVGVEAHATFPQCFVRAEEVNIECCCCRDQGEGEELWELHCVFWAANESFES